MHSFLALRASIRSRLSCSLTERRFVLAALFLFGILCLSCALMHGFDLYINTSDSLPKGLYKVTRGQSIQKGDLVLSCLKDEDSRMAFERGYIGVGTCPLHHAGIGKHVAATQGDLVEIDETGIKVNLTFVPKSKPARADGHGQLLPNINLKVRLGAGEYVLVNSAANSFDSRYLGLFDRSQVQGHLTALVTFD